MLFEFSYIPTAPALTYHTDIAVFFIFIFFHGCLFIVFIYLYFHAIQILGCEFPKT